MLEKTEVAMKNGIPETLAALSTRYITKVNKARNTKQN